MKKIFLAAITLLLCGSVFSQIYTPVIPTVYGKHELRAKADSAQHIPEKDSTYTNTADTTAQIFINKKDSAVWIYTKARGFFKLEGSAGAGSISFSDTLVLIATKFDLAGYVKYTDTSSMLSNYFKEVGYGLLRTGNIPRLDSATIASYFLRRKDSVDLNGYATQYDLTQLSTENFANTDLTFTGDRTHDIDGNDVTLNNGKNWIENYDATGEKRFNIGGAYHSFKSDKLEHYVEFGSDYGYINLEPVTGLNLSGGNSDMEWSLIANQAARWFQMYSNKVVWLKADSAIAIEPSSTSVKLNFFNLPNSDTASYVMGITANGRAVLQTKSALGSGGTPGIDDVLAIGQSLTTDRSINAGLHGFSIGTPNGGFSMKDGSQTYLYGSHTDGNHSVGLMLNPSNVVPYGNYARLQTYYAGTQNNFYLYPDSASFDKKLIRTNGGADSVAMLSDVRSIVGTGGGTSGIDDVLAQAQDLTTNREINAAGTTFKIKNTNLFDINSGTTGSGSEFHLQAYGTNSGALWAQNGSGYIDVSILANTGDGNSVATLNADGTNVGTQYIFSDTAFRVKNYYGAGGYVKFYLDSLEEDGTTGQVLYYNRSTHKVTFGAPTGGGVGITQEQSEDYTGALFATDNGDIDFTYNDGTPDIGAQIKSGVIVNADINSSAAISITKLNITGTPDGTKFLRDDGSWQNVTSFAYSRNMITSTAIATDANITAVAGRAYALPASTLTANRTIDVSGLTIDGDYVEFQNQETGFLWSFTGATVYDSDGVTAITELLLQANSCLRVLNGKIIISQL